MSKKFKPGAGYVAPVSLRKLEQEMSVEATPRHRSTQVDRGGDKTAGVGMQTLGRLVQHGGLIAVQDCLSDAANSQGFTVKRFANPGIGYVFPPQISNPAQWLSFRRQFDNSQDLYEAVRDINAGKTAAGEQPVIADTIQYIGGLALDGLPKVRSGRHFIRLQLNLEPSEEIGRLQDERQFVVDTLFPDAEGHTGPVRDRPFHIPLMNIKSRQYDENLQTLMEDAISLPSELTLGQLTLYDNTIVTGW